jgi:hypothetical protein
MRKILYSFLSVYSIQRRRKLEEREITAEIRRCSAKEKETYERQKKKMSELKEDSRK